MYKQEAEARLLISLLPSVAEYEQLRDRQDEWRHPGHAYKCVHSVERGWKEHKRVTDGDVTIEGGHD